MAAAPQRAGPSRMPPAQVAVHLIRLHVISYGFMRSKAVIPLSA